MATIVTNARLRPSVSLLQDVAATSKRFSTPQRTGPFCCYGNGRSRTIQPLATLEVVLLLGVSLLQGVLVRWGLLLPNYAIVRVYYAPPWPWLALATTLLHTPGGRRMKSKLGLQRHMARKTLQLLSEFKWYQTSLLLLQTVYKDNS